MSTPPDGFLPSTHAEGAYERTVRTDGMGDRVDFWFEDVKAARAARATFAGSRAAATDARVQRGWDKLVRAVDRYLDAHKAQSARDREAPITHPLAYEYRLLLREMGARWDADKRQWMAKSAAKAGEILQAVEKAEREAVAQRAAAFQAFQATMAAEERRASPTRTPTSVTSARAKVPSGRTVYWPTRVEVGELVEGARVLAVQRHRVTDDDGSFDPGLLGHEGEVWYVVTLEAR